ncbi:MAG: GH3 auxin-responsive promoter family protein, partial [Bacteroidales bacterium]|nr:GH3 auxin-responsive promoter family protein [Bacteroidales bacterium]
MLYSAGAKFLSAIMRRRFKRWYKEADKLQERTFRELIDTARNTAFGKDHHFDEITDYASFRKRVPVRDYEGLQHYVDRIVGGEDNVLWPGRPLYFSKTSGTTSGAKYIPITKASMPHHINGARHALLMYVWKTGKTDFLKGRMIFVSGSPELDRTGDVLTGRLSGIVHHHIPGYISRRRLPSFDTNCIPDWDEKLNAIVGETMNENMTLISGIPPWVEMYFEKLLEHSGRKTVAELFHGFSLFVYGGVN